MKKAVGMFKCYKTAKKVTDGELNQPQKPGIFPFWKNP